MTACTTTTTVAMRAGCLSPDLLADIDGLDIDATIAAVNRLVATLAPCAEYVEPLSEVQCCTAHVGTVRDALDAAGVFDLPARTFFATTLADHLDWDEDDVWHWQ